jgi:hypothetical protein
MRAEPAIAHLRSQADRLTGARDAAVKQVADTRKAIKTLEDESELLGLVQGILRKLIDREVTAGVEVVERLMTEGLQAVFHDQKLSVESQVNISRGKVSVDLITVHERPDGTIIRGVSNDAFGGAVATVQSVLLRIIVMKRRGLRPLLLLDESLPAFDGNYVQNMGEFLQLICERLNIDILLVTHNPALVDASTRAYRIARTKSGARFERMR